MLQKSPSETPTLPAENPSLIANLSSGDPIFLEQFLEEGGSPNHDILTKRTVYEHVYILARKTPKSSEHLSQLMVLLKKDILPDYMKKCILKNLEESNRLMYHLQYELIEENHTHNKTIKFLIDSLSENISLSIKTIALSQKSAQKLHSCPDFSKLTTTPAILEKIWAITCSKKTSEIESILKEKPARLCFIRDVIGLQSIIQNLDIILGINTLYSYFDSQQKLIAVLVVLTMLSFESKPIPFSDFHSSFALKQFFSLIPKQPRDILKKLIHAKSTPILINIELLCAWFNNNPLAYSFDTIVRIALEKTPKMRKKEAEIIAHEIKAFSVNSYKSVTPYDFSHTQLKQKLSDAINQHTFYANKLTYYVSAHTPQSVLSARAI